jgi:hypothetical protein
MATDDERQAAKVAEFWKKLNAMVATAGVKKRYDAASPCRHHAPGGAARGCRPRQGGPCRSSSNRPSFAYAAPTLASHATSSDDDYKVVVIANIHVQATGVQNIRSLISVMLDLSFMHYVRWRNNVLFTLTRYSLCDHVR